MPTWLNFVISVMRNLINSSAMPPDAKTALHTTLDGVETQATGVAGVVSTVANQATGVVSTVANQATGVLSTVANQATGVVSTVANVGSAILSDLSEAPSIVAAGAEAVATDLARAPSIVAAGAEAVATDLASATKNPIVETVVGMAGGEIGAIVDALVTKFIDIFEAHNTALINDIKSLASTTSSSST